MFIEVKMNGITVKSKRQSLEEGNVVGKKLFVFKVESVCENGIYMVI